MGWKRKGTFHLWFIYSSLSISCTLSIVQDLLSTIYQLGFVIYHFIKDLTFIIYYHDLLSIISRCREYVPVALEGDDGLEAEEDAAPHPVGRPRNRISCLWFSI